MIARGWKDIQKMTKMSRDTILKLCKDKKNPFPLKKVSGQYMLSEQEFIEYIQKLPPYKNVSSA